MRGIVAAAAAVLAVAAAGCSGGDSASDQGAGGTVTPSVALPAPTKTPEIIIGGKTYPMTFYQCADKLWSTRVAGWNGLSGGERDRWDRASADGFTGFEDYMRSKGWPVSHQATLDAASTRKGCPAG